jgi:hypothetical protein
MHSLTLTWPGQGYIIVIILLYKQATSTTNIVFFFHYYFRFSYLAYSLDLINQNQPVIFSSVFLSQHQHQPDLAGQKSSSDTGPLLYMYTGGAIIIIMFIATSQLAIMHAPNFQLHIHICSGLNDLTYIYQWRTRKLHQRIEYLVFYFSSSTNIY